MRRLFNGLTGSSARGKLGEMGGGLFQYSLHCRMEVGVIQKFPGRIVNMIYPVADPGVVCLVCMNYH